MQVNFYAGAADAAGTTTAAVPLGPITAGELVAHLGSDNPRLAHVLGACSLLVDGRPVGAGDAIAEDARVDVLPPFAGG